MARTLNIYTRTTPTYIFQITDMDSSGVDVASMKIMMCLNFSYTDNTVARTTMRYVGSSAVEDHMAQFVMTEDSKWIDDSYAINKGAGVFALTIPFWRWTQWDVTSAISYQVFLWHDVVINGGSIINPGDGSDLIVSPALIRHHNILIDEGVFEWQPSLFPLTVQGLERMLYDAGVSISDIESLAVLDANDPNWGESVTEEMYDTLCRISQLTLPAGFEEMITSIYSGSGSIFRKSEAGETLPSPEELEEDFGDMMRLFVQRFAIGNKASAK